ncbi:hypothetical protein M5K25_000535 [Dendrobium thyrsiflorum]|uniref:Alpha-ketoglutarate-dependent dioxygenase AlkB-like domain-containing protein n=1 Tax=Dendrobium thyrsiflorum TaxID=117978 RepID=A0ABD0VTV2_DENTH
MYGTSEIVDAAAPLTSVHPQSGKIRHIGRQISLLLLISIPSLNHSNNVAQLLLVSSSTSAGASIDQFSVSKSALRNYAVSLPHKRMPDDLCLVAKKMAVPAMPNGEEFKPEAAIVNYFGPSDMLGGHLDDMEKDWSKPIVSICLGCKAIFLLGGKSREDMPIAMFLRSGDIVLMAGEARECFHGQSLLYLVMVFILDGFSSQIAECFYITSAIILLMTQ